MLCVPAGAQSLCTAPVPPPPLNGAHATAEQVRGAIASARGFIGKANLYESCLKDEMRADQVRAAALGGGSGAAPDKETQVRIAANRRLRDKVSQDAAAALDAYKKAHAD